MIEIVISVYLFVMVSHFIVSLLSRTEYKLVNIIANLIISIFWPMLVVGKIIYKLILL